MSKVELQGLVKSFPNPKGGEVRAVKGIDLEIGEGEFMVLVGPSGCGKSTTLRMVAGLEEVSSGRVLIGGREVNSVPPKDRDIAMVFQNYALYPHLSVYDNMAFGLRMRKAPSEEIDARVREASAMLGLDACLDRRPKALSGGQRQRVALGRAIVRRPKVFLFDEPLSNLDAQMRSGMRAEIARLHARLGATMIYVTHDQSEAMTLGDRICVMKDGAIEQVDAPLRVYDRPSSVFVAGFIGSPAMNLVRGSLRADGGGLAFADEASALVLPLPTALARGLRAGAPAVLGVRPEDIGEFSQAPPCDPKGGAEAVVEVVEPMGPETFLHLRAGPNLLIARVRSDRAPAIGSRMRAVFDLARAHLFDPAGGKRMG